jgi:uncharacterized protein with HEPN domain
MAVDKDLFRLKHIRESIAKIQTLVGILKTYDTFETRWIEQDALIRNFEIIGEASNHVSERLRKSYPNLPWNEMRAMRNFMTHQYFGLQLDTIWDTAVNDIPVLKIQIEEIIANLEK